MTSEFISMTLPELAGYLGKLYRQKSTGSFIGVDDSGASLVVAVQDGDIVGLSSRTTAGVRAIGELQSMTHCKGQFRARMVLRTDADLPPTRDLLSALDPAEQNAGVEPPVQTSNQATEMCEKLKTEARRLFGPAAGLFVEERLAASGPLADPDDLRRLLHLVAADMGEPALASQLIANVMGATGLEQRSGQRANG